jgi:hypothetical protein
MKNVAATIAVLGLTVSGCATGSAGVHANYAPPMMYQGYSCQQLAMEDQRLRNEVAQLKGDVDQNAQHDRIMTGVGVFLFWPALFFIQGNGEDESTYAELKGQHEAIEQSFVLKNCSDPTAAANTAAPVPMTGTRTRF